MSSQTPGPPQVPETLIPYEDLENTRPRPWRLEQDVFDAICTQFNELPLDCWGSMRFRVEKWTREELARRRPAPRILTHPSTTSSQLASAGVPTFEDVDPSLLAKLIGACLEREKQRR